MNTTVAVKAGFFTACLALVASACSSSGPAAQSSVSAPPDTSSVATTTAPDTASPSAPLTSAASPPTAVSPTTSTSRTPAPTKFQPASVTFVSADSGFVLGVSPCGAGMCTAVVATRDGGRTWSFVANVSATVVGNNPAVRTIRFASLRDGWIFGPQLWATHDGGRSWKRINESAAVVDVEASNGQAYALVGNQLVRTPVGSDSWSSVAGVPQPVDGRSISLHGAAVWVVTNHDSIVTRTDGANWRTVDNVCAALGSQSQSSLGPQWQLFGLAPVDATQLYLVCGGGGAAGSEAKKVLLSSDGGAHAVPTGIEPPLAGDLNGVAAASKSVVAVSARSGASFVYRSGDAGRTWQVPLQQGDGGAGYFDLGFTTSSQGVAVYGSPAEGVPSKLLMTHDAGASWRQVAF